MYRKLPVEPILVLKSAAIMFLAPVPLLLAVLLGVGVAQFLATGDVSVAQERLETFRHSPVNVWLSYAAYSVAGVVVGYRLAARLRVAAIPYIWAAAALAMFAHVSLHAASDVTYIGVLAVLKYLQLPVAVVVAAFAGFHTCCWHRWGVLIKR